MSLYPITFHPLYKERIWGGRSLERLYNKQLPPNIPIGESWEISDRPGDSNVIANGRLAGKDLHWLMENHRIELLGRAGESRERFPLLIKILDAQDTLSLQVHPPASKASAMGGEPKTEMWYVAESTPDAQLYVGLKKGVTRQEFETKISDGTVADCFHQIHVKKDDVMFLPSGRVHALGAGSVIFEIQQNSDTTYRVFDWNRVGLDGKPRELHIPQSLESIDFEDFEPRLIHSIYSRNAVLRVRFLVDDPLFRVDACQVNRGERFYLRSDGAQILGVLKGTMELQHGNDVLEVHAGQFVLLPASLEKVTIIAKKQIEFLHVQVR